MKIQKSNFIRLIRVYFTFFQSLLPQISFLLFLVLNANSNTLHKYQSNTHLITFFAVQYAFQYIARKKLMKKEFRTGDLIFTIDETDVRWSSKNQTGGLPVNTILSINYGNGVITFVCNGFVEKLIVPNSDQSRVAAIQMNNCVTSIKEGDFEVLKSAPLKTNSGSSWKITKGGWWAIGIAGLFVFSYIMKEKEAYDQKSKLEDEKAAYDALTQPQKDSILAAARQKTKEEQEHREQIRKNEITEEKAFLNTKAGKIWKKHPKWSKADCIMLAKGEIWIGMDIYMVVYLRGNPDSATPSDYGNGKKWQWCWNDHTPSCFYDDNEDNLVDSYN